MNPGLLVKQFDRISDAPDATPRLRRFVLDLAVRGKLVEQDPTDEPASALIKRVRLRKAEIAKKGAARKEKPFPPLAENALPFRIPPTWTWSQIAEIGFLNPRNTAENQIQSSFVPMPRISAEYGVSNTHEVRPWGEIKSGFTHFAEGDVGLAKITPCFENGKSAIFRGLTGGIGAGTTELHIVRPVIVLADYVLIFLKSPHFIESGTAQMTGTAGQKRVSSEYFAYSPFPLPPLAEQHRIVAKVNELMALCDRLETARAERESRRDQLAAASHHHVNNGVDSEIFREHAKFHINHLWLITTRPDQIKRFRQTILNLAVRGMLLKMDEGFSAMQLLQTVKTERLGMRSTNADLAKTASEFETLEQQQRNMEIPNAYITARCACHFITKGTTPAHEKLLRAGEVPFLKVYNIVDNKLDFDYKPTFISRAVHQNELRRSKVLPGDVLMNIVGPPLGKVALVTDQYPEWNINQAIAVFRPLSSFDSRFLMIVLSSLATIAEVLKETRGVVGQDNLSLEQVRSLRIPLLPLAHQRRIVAKVDELMLLCDRLEAQLSTAQSETSRLLESVLHHALNDSYCAKNEMDKQSVVSVR